MPVSVSPDTINTITDRLYVKKMRDNFFLGSALWFKLKKNEDPVNGGRKIVEQISHSKSTTAGAWGGGTDVLPTVFQDHMTEAVWSPVYYYASITIPETEEIKNAGQGEIVNIIESQTELAEMSLKDTMGVDIYSDGSNDSNGKKRLDGLQAVITHGADPSVGAYGGITRVGASGAKASPTLNAFWCSNPVAINANTTVTRWKGAEAFDSSTTLTIEKMQKCYGFTMNGNEAADILTCGQAIWNKYWSLLTAIQRQASDEEIGKSGFKSLLFNSVPITVDDNVDAATKLYMINSRYLKLRPFKRGNFKVTPFRHPPNQMVNQKFITWMGNVVSPKPQAHAVLTAITT